MPNDRLFEVDESVARAMRDECVDGRMSLLDDLRGGIHARAVISEIQHAQSAKHRGEHTVAAGDIEMRLTHVMHGAGFHQLALKEGTYECWDDDDFTNWGPRRAGDVQVKYTPRNTIIQGFAFKGSSRLNPPPI
jgi:hypothetical protein